MLKWTAPGGRCKRVGARRRVAPRDDLAGRGAMIDRAGGAIGRRTRNETGRGQATVKRRLLWALLIPAVVALAAFFAIESWGGINRSATSILRNGTRAEAFRVSPKYSPERTDITIGGYPIIATGAELGPEFVARLATVLRRWGVSKGSKKCTFEPGVAFRVWSGDRALDVLICFECDELWTHVVGDTGSSDDDVLDFAPVRADLVTLVKEAFPDNAKIQALPAIHP